MKRILSLLLALSLLPALGGCGGEKEVGFTLNLPGNISSLDPQTASGSAARTVIGSIFEGLCRVSPDSKAVPGVAQRWESSGNATVFTFHLRDARWSDGAHVTAEDFIFGITRALSPEASPSFPEELAILRNARAYYDGEVDSGALGLEAKDERTLVIYLEYPYADFPLLTAGMKYMPCNREYFDECAGHYGLSAGYLLTNGPFTFPHEYAWNTDRGERSVNLVRSSEYRGEHRVRPSSLTYLIDYDDAINKDPVTALVQGDIDLLEVTETQAAQAQEQGCRVLSAANSVMGLMLNQDCDALGYLDTRALFLKTLDRENLLALGVTETRPEAIGLMPEGVLWNGGPYYAEGERFYPEQDDGAAAIIPSLLELMKWERIPPITVLCPDDEASIQLANGFLISWNGKLGSAFNIQPLPENELLRRVSQGDYEAALYALQIGGATPLDALRSAAEVLYPPLGEDASGRNYDLNTVLQGLTFNKDSFQTMEDALAGQYLFYPLLKRDSYYALAPGVSGIAVSPDGWINFAQGGKK